MLKRRVQQRR